MAERLAQDQAQYQESLHPSEVRRIQEENRKAQEQYEKDLAQFELESKEYEKALLAYETEVKRQDDLRKADEKRIADEQAKIAADQKKLNDLAAVTDSKIRTLEQQRDSAISAYNATANIDGQRIIPKAQQDETRRQISKNYLLQIEEVKRADAITYQQAAFAVNYPDAGMLGGTWYRDWKANPLKESLSSRYESELQRRNIQAQRSREVSIQNAQANARSAAEKYSVDVTGYSKHITNFGGEGLREFSRKELARREAIKPTAPSAEAIGVSQRTGGLIKAVNMSPRINVKFETKQIPLSPAQVTLVEPKLTLQEKQDNALADYLNQYKSTTQPSATVLQSVVAEKSGEKPTKQTQSLIASMTTLSAYSPSSYPNIITDKKTGETFDTKTGEGSYKLGTALGYQYDQNMQKPEVQTETIPIFALPSIDSPRTDISLTNQAIEKGLKFLDKQSKSWYPDKPDTWVAPQAAAGLAYAGLTTLATLSNVWTQKVETAYFKEPEKQKFESSSGLPSIAEAITYLKTGVAFRDPIKEPIRIPNESAFGVVLEDPMVLPDYVAKRGVPFVVGEFSEIAVGGFSKGAVKTTGSELVFGKQAVEVTGKELIISGRHGLVDPNYLKWYFKPKATATGFINEGFGIVEKKSLKEIIKTPFTKQGNIPEWVIDDYIVKSNQWKKLTPVQQSDLLAQESLQQQKLKAGLLYDTNRYTAGNFRIKYKPISNFVKTTAPLGASLAGVITKTQNAPSLNSIYKEQPYRPSVRANEIDYTDSAVWKPSFDYSKMPDYPKPITTVSVTPTSVFKPSTVTKSRFKTDAEIQKDIEKSGGTVNKDGTVTITKQEAKQESKTVTKQTLKQESKITGKQESIQIFKNKQKLKSKYLQRYGQSLGAVQLLKYKQAQKQKYAQVQVYKQAQKQKYAQIQVYRQAQKQRYKQPQVFKQKTDQLYKLKQKQVFKQQTKLELKTPLRLKLKAPLKIDVPIPPRFKIVRQKTRPPKDPFKTKKTPIPTFDEKKRKESKTKKQKAPSVFTGNVSEVKIEGVYDRVDLVRGKKKVAKLRSSDLKKYMPKKKSKRFNIF